MSLLKLDTYDISRQDFHSEKIAMLNDNPQLVLMLYELEAYYNEKKQLADRLTMEDEFVGITYNNLDEIKYILTKKVR